MKTKEEIQKLRQDIIDVCLSLLDNGLIVRTWGNVSAKLDDEHFLITPSGIKYEDLEPLMLPVVDMNDLSYEGDFKPSSEMLVHKAIYSSRRDAEFIVHTHQTYASLVGTLGKTKLKAEKNNERIAFPIADYALPGTTKLAENVKKSANLFPETKSIIMSNHGSVSFGRSAQEAVNEAYRLEKASKAYINTICRTQIKPATDEGYSSYLENGKIVYEKADTPNRVKQIHELIYAKRSDVEYIYHIRSEAVLLISRRANHMKPLLDDFAQIVGTGIRIPTSEGQRKSVKKTVNAVFSYNDGAYCLGESRDEAMACAIVLDKGCLAHIAATRFGKGNFLSYFDCYKMNKNYRKNYSNLSHLVK
ncbi:MAG: class II aldolase/adducin family protein [Butyrivibrio sp.]|nr:class II aldolase/adducin family protein [Butyrivibrio sp.]